MGLSPASILYDANGNPVSIVDDSGVYRISGLTKVLNASGSQVNPATEDTLATRASEATLQTADGRLATIDSVLDSIKDTDGIKKITDPLPAGTNNIGDVDVVSSALPAGAATEATLATRATETTLATRASESTLLTADGRLTTIDAVLDSIKDTDGIKKITDQLPAGTNEIGKVAQGTRAAASGGWPEYIVDASGNVVGVVLDGSVYRLQSDAKVAKGASNLVHLDAIDTVSGMGRLKATLYSQDGDAIAFGSVAPNPENIKNDFVEDTGSSDDLLVNGSVTPVEFTYSADATHDISILEVKFVLASNSITFGTDYFGAVSGPLTNGVLVEVTSNGNTGTVANLIQNEDFVHFSSPGGFTWIVSSKDMMSATWLVGGGLKLFAGTVDKIKITIRDNLSSAGVYFKCFVKGNILV